MISVIVVDHDNLELTKLCLESLYQTTYKDKEIIVLDNGSGGAVRRFYYGEAVQHKIRFYDFILNVGLARAFNQGAKLAKGEYLFFLNNDTKVRKDIFDKLLQSKYDITGCRMFDYAGHKELDSAISVDRFGCPAGNTGQMFYPDGAIFMKKEVFEDLGGFDERMFLYGEDRDLCWRAWLGGYNVGRCDTAYFYHASTCVSDTNYFRRHHSEKNIIRSMLKNYSLGTLCRVLPCYGFWSLLEIGLLLFKEPRAIFKSYLPAYWWNIKNLKDTIRKRKEVKHRLPDFLVPFSRKIGKLNTLLTEGVPKFKGGRYA